LLRISASYAQNIADHAKKLETPFFFAYICSALFKKLKNWQRKFLIPRIIHKLTYFNSKIFYECF